MEPDSSRRRPLYEVYRYSGLGCLFAAAVLVWMVGGWLLDRWLGVMPAFTIAGALIGAVLGTVVIYRRLQAGVHDEGERRGGDRR